MAEKRKLHGYKLLHTLKGRNFTLKLFAQNGSKFVIIANYHIWRVVYNTKRFEFATIEEAEYYIHRVSARKGLLNPILM
jgi:hypothetical protein